MSFHHKYSIEEFENLIPFERDILIDLTADYVKEQEEKQEVMKVSRG